MRKNGKNITNTLEHAFIADRILVQILNQKFVYLVKEK